MRDKPLRQQTRTICNVLRIAVITALGLILWCSVGNVLWSQEKAEPAEKSPIEKEHERFDAAFEDWLGDTLASEETERERSKERRLVDERRKALAERVTLLEKEHSAGRATWSEMSKAIRDLHRAELEATDRSEEREAKQIALRPLRLSCVPQMPIWHWQKETARRLCPT